MADILISIILPLHNQGDHIAIIVDEYIKILSHIRCDKEYLLVANGCRDNTVEVCHGLSQKHKVIRVIESKTKGWGLAVKLGLREAKGDMVCYTNAARTSPQDLAVFLLYAVANPNLVIKATRKTREKLKRRLGSVLYNLECRFFFDLSCWDINGTPKVFPRHFGHLLKLTRDDDLIDLEFNIICRRKNYPMLQLPIFSTRRHGGASTTNYRSAFGMYMGAYKMWRKIRSSSK